MKKIISLCLILLTVFSVMSFTSCTKDENNSAKTDSLNYEFSDSLGNKISLKSRPKKVAVLFSSYAEVWTIAGGKIGISVGEAVERGFVESSVELVDSSAGKAIDNESLINYEPDFVICSAEIPAQKKTAELLNSQGIPCAAFKVDSFDDYLSMLKICTDITGESSRYEEYGTKVQKRIDDILNKAKNENEEKILFIRAGSSEKYTKAKTAEDHFAAKMLKELGTKNIAENAPVLLDGLSTEEIVSENPDCIFISLMGSEQAAKKHMESVFQSSAWQSLKAVKENKCYYLPKDLFQFKPNNRWDEAYLYLAKTLYPNVNFGE